MWRLVGRWDLARPKRKDFSASRCPRHRPLTVGVRGEVLMTSTPIFIPFMPAPSEDGPHLPEAFSSTGKEYNMRVIIASMAITGLLPYISACFLYTAACFYWNSRPKGLRLAGVAVGGYQVAPRTLAKHRNEW